MPSLSSFASLSLVATVAASTLRDYKGYDFATYVAEFGKEYLDTHEFAIRKDTFEQNLRTLQIHNRQYQAANQSWFMAINEFADMSAKEFGQMRMAKYSPSGFPTVDLGASKSKANPATWDWRDHGAVSKVKNQGGCGSCWAFSATETVESHYQIASKNLLELAPQTYVNCVKNPKQCGGTGGCEGATMELAFNLTASAGIALESALPYKGRDEQCAPYTAAVKCTGYVKNPVNDAGALETAIATKGPMSVTVAAASWQMYGGGVFKGCSGFMGDNTLDHGVQAVGYAQDYWIVRNSWGPGWGEKGYIRLSRSADAKTFTDKRPADGTACKPLPKTQTVGGECGVLYDTSYPTGVSA